MHLGQNFKKIKKSILQRKIKIISYYLRLNMGYTQKWDFELAGLSLIKKYDALNKKAYQEALKLGIDLHLVPDGKLAYLQRI